MRTLPNTPSARGPACTALELRKREAQVNIHPMQDPLQLLEGPWREHLIRAYAQILVEDDTASRGRS